MKLAAIIILVTGIQATAAAAQDPAATVTVYVANGAGVPIFVKYRAQARATAMFARIGVAIQWRSGTPAGSSNSGAIQIELGTRTPAALQPGAFAYALPYEGVHIKLFCDRIPRNSEAVLAYVMVHEISHILEGLIRHSETGVMKARWTPDDLRDAEHAGLEFAPEDVTMIQNGLLQRNALLARQARFASMNSGSGETEIRSALLQ